jgi:integrating conjugative element membrane protein (TIGR03745 family)
MKKLKEKILLATVSASLFVNEVAAQVGGTLPTAPTPTKGDGGGNWLVLAQNWASDAVIVVGIIMAAIVFIQVARNVMAAYGDSVEGRGTLGAVLMQAVVGVAIIGLIILLITQANSVFA